MRLFRRTHRADPAILEFPHTLESGGPGAVGAVLAARFCSSQGKALGARFRGHDGKEAGAKRQIRNH